jgi:REP element-mobilizing transposase RayT
MSLIGYARVSSTDQSLEVQRGNNRQVSFFAEQDYAVYLDKLKDYAEKYKVAVHAYVLMTNHVHLLLTPAIDKGRSRLMQALGRYYVMYMNKIKRSDPIDPIIICLAGIKLS